MLKKIGLLTKKNKKKQENRKWHAALLNEDRIGNHQVINK